MGGPEKRPANEETGGAREAKRPSTDADGAPAPAEAAPAAAPASCTWGSGGSSFSSLAGAGTTKPGGGSGCSWGSTGGGGFAAIGSAAGFGSSAVSAPAGFGAVSGGGFGAAAAESGFGAVSAGFGGGTGGSRAGGGPAPAAFGTSALNPNAAEFVPKPLGADAGAAEGEESGDVPSGAVDEDGEGEPQEPSLLVGSGTGEEGEMCAHRVRAKLFRLESRDKEGDKEAGKEGDAGDEAAGGTPASGAGAPAGSKDAAETGATAGAGARGGGEHPPSTEPPSKPGAPAAAAPAPPAGIASDDTGEGVPSSPAGGALPTRWVERGVGQVRLLVPEGGSRKSPPRLVMRVENVGRLILNEPLLPTTAPAVRASDTSVRLALVSASLQPQSYLFRVKMPAEAEALLRAINSHIPASE